MILLGSILVRGVKIVSMATFLAFLTNTYIRTIYTVLEAQLLRPPAVRFGFGGMNRDYMELMRFHNEVAYGAGDRERMLNGLGRAEELLQEARLQGNDNLNDRRDGLHDRIVALRNEMLENNQGEFQARFRILLFQVFEFLHVQRARRPGFIGGHVIPHQEAAPRQRIQIGPGGHDFYRPGNVITVRGRVLNRDPDVVMNIHYGHENPALRHQEWQRRIAVNQVPAPNINNATRGVGTEPERQPAGPAEDNGIHQVQQLLPEANRERQRIQTELDRLLSAHAVQNTGSGQSTHTRDLSKKGRRDHLIKHMQQLRKQLKTASDLNPGSGELQNQQTSNIAGESSYANMTSEQEKPELSKPNPSNSLQSNIVQEPCIESSTETNLLENARQTDNTTEDSATSSSAVGSRVSNRISEKRELFNEDLKECLADQAHIRNQLEVGGFSYKRLAQLKVRLRMLENRQQLLKDQLKRYGEQEPVASIKEPNEKNQSSSESNVSLRSRTDLADDVQRLRKIYEELRDNVTAIQKMCANAKNVKKRNNFFHAMQAALKKRDKALADLHNAEAVALRSGVPETAIRSCNTPLNLAHDEDVIKAAEEARAVAARSEQERQHDVASAVTTDKHLRAVEPNLGRTGFIDDQREKAESLLETAPANREQESLHAVPTSTYGPFGSHLMRTGFADERVVRGVRDSVPVYIRSAVQTLNHVPRDMRNSTNVRQLILLHRSLDHFYRRIIDLQATAEHLHDMSYQIELVENLQQIENQGPFYEVPALIQLLRDLRHPADFHRISHRLLQFCDLVGKRLTTLAMAVRSDIQRPQGGGQVTPNPDLSDVPFHRRDNRHRAENDPDCFLQRQGCTWSTHLDYLQRFPHFAADRHFEQRRYLRQRGRVEPPQALHGNDIYRYNRTRCHRCLNHGRVELLSGLHNCSFVNCTCAKCASLNRPAETSNEPTKNEGVADHMSATVETVADTVPEVSRSGNVGPLPVKKPFKHLTDTQSTLESNLAQVEGQMRAENKKCTILHMKLKAARETVNSAREMLAESEREAAAAERVCLID